jgi:hypothetical protein
LLLAKKPTKFSDPVIYLIPAVFAVQVIMAWLSWLTYYKSKKRNLIVIDFNPVAAEIFRPVESFVGLFDQIVERGIDAIDAA